MSSTQRKSGWGIVSLVKRFKNERRRTAQKLQARRMMFDNLEDRRMLASITSLDAGDDQVEVGSLRAGDNSRIVINDGDGAAAAIALGGGHPAVVELFIGSGLCSGTLITNQHVVTAKHCTIGASAASMTVNFHHVNNDGTPDATRSVSAKAEVAPTAGWNPNTNDLIDGTDLAVLTLSSAAPAGVVPVPFGISSSTGVTGRTVGFGLNGLGSVGHGNSRDGLRWAGDNVIDAIGAARDVGGVKIGGTTNIYNTDFDDGTSGSNTLSPGVSSSKTPIANESTTAGGDSGGPLLVGGEIVAVLSGGTTALSVFSDISWWTGTLAHKAFITTNAPGAVFNVPSPVKDPGSPYVDANNDGMFSIVDGDVLLRAREVQDDGKFSTKKTEGGYTTVIKDAGLVVPASTGSIVAPEVKLEAEGNVVINTDLVSFIKNLTVTSKKASVIFDDPTIHAGSKDIKVKAKEDIFATGGDDFFFARKIDFKAGNNIILEDAEFYASDSAKFKPKNDFRGDGSIFEALDPTKGKVDINAGFIDCAACDIKAGKSIKLNSKGDIYLDGAASLVAFGSKGTVDIKAKGFIDLNDLIGGGTVIQAQKKINIDGKGSVDVSFAMIGICEPVGGPPNTSGDIKIKAGTDIFVDGATILSPDKLDLLGTVMGVGSIGPGTVICDC